MQVIIDASNIMIIAIAYIAIGLAWIAVRQQLRNPPRYWNPLQSVAAICLWPLGIVIYAIERLNR